MNKIKHLSTLWAGIFLILGLISCAKNKASETNPTVIKDNYKMKPAQIVTKNKEASEFTAAAAKAKKFAVNDEFYFDTSSTVTVKVKMSCNKGKEKYEKVLDLDPKKRTPLINFFSEKNFESYKNNLVNCSFLVTGKNKIGSSYAYFVPNVTIDLTPKNYGIILRHSGDQLAKLSTEPSVQLGNSEIYYFKGDSGVTKLTMFCDEFTVKATIHNWPVTFDDFDWSAYKGLTPQNYEQNCHAVAQFNRKVVAFSKAFKIILKHNIIQYSSSIKLQVPKPGDHPVLLSVSTLANNGESNIYMLIPNLNGKSIKFNYYFKNPKRFASATTVRPLQQVIQGQSGPVVDGYHQIVITPHSQVTMRVGIPSKYNCEFQNNMLRITTSAWGVYANLSGFVNIKQVEGYSKDKVKKIVGQYPVFSETQIYRDVAGINRKTINHADTTTFFHNPFIGDKSGRLSCGFVGLVKP